MLVSSSVLPHPKDFDSHQDDLVDFRLSGPRSGEQHLGHRVFVNKVPYLYEPSTGSYYLTTRATVVAVWRYPGGSTYDPPVLVASIAHPYIFEMDWPGSPLPYLKTRHLGPEFPDPTPYAGAPRFPMQDGDKVEYRTRTRQCPVTGYYLNTAEGPVILRRRLQNPTVSFYTVWPLRVWRNGVWTGYNAPDGTPILENNILVAQVRTNSPRPFFGVDNKTRALTSPDPSALDARVVYEPPAPISYEEQKRRARLRTRDRKRTIRGDVAKRS